MNLADHYATSLHAAESRVAGITGMQVRNPDHRDYGGYLDPNVGYTEPGTSAGQAVQLLLLYCNPDSRYHREPSVLESARLYLDHLLREQHEDGTIDLKCTNFHCSSTIAFSIQGFAYLWRVLERHDMSTLEEERVRTMARRYVEQSAAGMLGGGFHTPNHRWVLVSALSLLYRILGDERLRREAELYLREGIDSDADGEYTERSVGVYNMAVNRSLLIAAEELGKPELLDPVKRNLDSVLRYWEPDDTLYTLGSRRQDYGTEARPLGYYDNYLFAGLALENPEYLFLADHIRDLSLALGRPVSALGRFMADPDLQALTPESRPRSFDCEYLNTRSTLLRIREGDRSLSVLSGNTRFLKYQVGGNSVYLRCAATFFGDKGRFVSEAISSTPQGYRLRYFRRWGYKRPLDSTPPSGDWLAMDHDSRDEAQMQDYEVTAEVVRCGGDVQIHFRTSGCSGVLLKVELIFKPGGYLDTADVRLPGKAGGYAFHKQGCARYTLGCDWIEVGEGFAEHGCAPAMRGGEESVDGAFTLYLTAYTPVDRRIRISGGSGM